MNLLERIVYKANRLCHRLIKDAPYWFKPMPDRLPLPPLALRYLVTGDIFDTIPDFYEAGRNASIQIVNALARQGVDINSFDCILDFGCGCGRTLRHFQNLREGVLHGSDYNQTLVEWSRRNIANVKFNVNQLSPPLPYANHQFDLIYAFSVFTHHPKELQAAWMSELSRILKPGGYLVISTLGAWAVPAEWRKQLDDGELVVVREDLAGANACLAYHTEATIRDKLAIGFELVEFRERAVWQDFCLLRKQ